MPLTLTNPQPINPIVQLDILSCVIDIHNGNMVIRYRRADQNGVAIDEQVVNGAMGPVRLANLKASLYTELEAALNVTGTVT